MSTSEVIICIIGWRDIRSAIGRTSATALGFATSNYRNDWYDGECEQLKNEKNAAWARMLQHRTRANEARYRQARNRQNSVFRMSELTRSRRGFVPQADMCRDNYGNILTSEREVVERWRQHYDEHLNGDVASTKGGVVTDLRVCAQDERLPAPDLREIEEEVDRLKTTKPLK